MLTMNARVFSATQPLVVERGQRVRIRLGPGQSARPFLPAPGRPLARRLGQERDPRGSLCFASRGNDLMGICLRGHMPMVESTFAIIAERNRREILSLLASSERSVGELEQELGLSQPSISKHLRVLRDAGFVEARVDAQRRVYRLRPAPLMEVDAWLAPFRRFWSTHLDALERHLDRMDAPPAKKGKKNR